MPTPITVKDIAVKMQGGKALNKKEKEFYEANVADVEKEVTALSGQGEGSPGGTNEAAGGAGQQTTTSFNPIKESVEEKTYSGQQQGGAQSGVPGSTVAEHNYTPAPEEEIIPEKMKTRQQEKAEENKHRPPEPANPDLKGASDQEKTQGAEQLAEVIFSAMGQIYAGVNQMIKIPEKKLNRMQQEGKINTRVEVPYKEGYAPISKVLKQYNEDASHLLEIEEEWKAAVKPALVQELETAGHGMSNKQFLIYMFTVKLGSDGFKVAQFLSLKKDYLRFAQEQTILDRKKRRGAIVTATAPLQEDLNEVTEQDEEIEEEIRTSTTLQEEAMNKMFPRNMAGPNFGSTNKMNKLRTADNVDKRTVKKQAKKTIDEVKNTASRVVRNDPPPDGKKKGRGRPPGAKNKPKRR